MNESADLSDVTTAELIAELKRRHDAIVLVTELDRTPDNTGYARYTKGQVSRLIGMLSRARLWLVKYAESNAVDVDE